MDEQDTPAGHIVLYVLFCIKILVSNWCLEIAFKMLIL